GENKIREFELEQVVLSEEFDILQIVGEGWFGKILLVEHRVTDTEMVLKALPKPYVTLKDFYTEFHYGLHLGSHKNIITTYDVAFETPGFYVFSQEYAPLGDLTSNVSETGIGELYSKRVAKQVSEATRSMDLAKNIGNDIYLTIKLCDFGETRKTGTLVRRRNEWLPYSPPDVLERNTDETYKAETSQDIWQFAIVVFVCLTGCLPWQKAAPDDPRYSRYLYWINSTGVLMPIRQPKLFKILSNKAQRWFRKFLEPRPDKRPKDLGEMYKYVEDRWLARSLTSNTNGNEEDGLCPSMYSFHSSADEKNKLLQTLTQYGIETTVDRGAKKDRIKAWIQSSVIEEDRDEDEEEERRDSAREVNTNLAREGNARNSTRNPSSDSRSVSK
ncbi:serine/threonine-protein kinase meng-po, partial [Diaphorina citri]|uniref:Serine/threonine-protein kinase meng-po n=1 Tax=Diaphorina citri TaxID=121845 RepID=A0A1S3DCI0_DIACI